MKKIIPIFINYQGCPFQCVFCNQNTITGHSTQSLFVLQKYVENEILKYTSKGLDLELAFYGGTFTGLPQYRMREYLQWAQSFSSVQSIRLSTRPDMITTEILNVLKKYNVQTIELGVQSLNDEVLKLSKRGYISRDVLYASNLIRQYDFKIGYQIMVGLPGETDETFLETIDKTVDLEPDMIRIYPTVIFKNTELEKMYLNGEYQPLQLEKGIELVAKALELIRKSNIEILRVGLHSVSDETEILAGCYHPQFRYMVESQIMLNKIKRLLKNNNKKTIIFIIHKKSHNYFVGFKKSNLAFLYNIGIENVQIEYQDIPVGNIQLG